MIPAIKPKILEEVYNINKEAMGKAGGIVLNSLNMDSDNFIGKFVYGIEKLKEDDIDSLIVEEISLLNKNDIQLIQTRTNLKILDGRRVLIFFLPLVLNKIYKRLKEDLKEKEVLIISDDEKLTKEVIEALYKEIRFVTLVGDDENSIENISKYILKKTGLSLFYSKNIDKILTNYSIIINLKDNTYIDINKIRKEALLFDLSIEKGLCKIAENMRGVSVIEDFIFEIDIETKWIENIVSSNIYEYFCEFKPTDLRGLLVNGRVNTIEDFIDYEIRSKGKL